jgi:predicted short-subunit dehydrogenase-like oxidoreductase (DUF2520 family)
VLAAAWADQHPVVAVSGRSDASSTRVETLLPGVRQTDPVSVASSAEIVLIAVPDDALPPLVAQLAAAGAVGTGQVVVHTSGRHGIHVLSPVRAAGAGAVALHPAMTFTGTDVDLPRLAGCVYGVTAPPAERELAEQLVADLGGRTTWVPDELRTLYHAGLAHGANHLVTLVSEAMELLAATGAEDPAATLRPLLTAALDNALTQGDSALTGPIVRGDVETVRAHLEDVRVTAPHTLPSYVAMARATLDRVVTDGRLLPIRAARIAALLDAASLDTAQSSAETVVRPAHPSTRLDSSR